MAWAILFLLVALTSIWGYVSSNIIIRIPRLALDANPKSFGYPFEAFQAMTDDGIAIEGWFVPAKKKSNSTLFILHGWGANKSDVVPSTVFLADHYNLAYFDFRNHGASGGNQTSLTCLEVRDFAAVVKYVKKNKGDETQKLGVYGLSMGGAVAITGSTEIPEIRAVIAESAFSSFNNAVGRFGVLFFGIPKAMAPLTLVFTRLRLGFDPEVCSPIHNIAKLSPRPVFLIQGASDLRMPKEEGEALYAAAKEPKELWTVPDSDHGEAWQKAPEEYKKRVLGFFQKYVP